MLIYRGCKEKGLKVMEPRLVNHGEAFVYGTTDMIEAIIYSVKGGNLNYTNIYGYDDDNSRCLIERKANCLEDIFNVEGRYYILDDKDFKKHDEVGVGNNEYVSTKPVKVLKEVLVSNVWNYLKELEKNGKLKIYRYPSRPNLYPADDSDLIECAISMYLNNGDLEGSFAFLEKYHPELKERNDKIKDFIRTHSREEVEKLIDFFNE